MALRNRQLMVAATLGVLALLGIAGLLVASGPAPFYALPAALLIAALSLIVFKGRLERADESVSTVRVELTLLRPGRLRDYAVRAVGYHRQFQALAETFPAPAVRVALREILPAVASIVRAVYDLCITLQAYELGESQPPALMARKAAERTALTRRADAALTSALDELGQLYAALRECWDDRSIDPAVVRTVASTLAPHVRTLRALAATFAGTSPEGAAGGPVPSYHRDR